jgi:hypothetical protein
MSMWSVRTLTESVFVLLYGQNQNIHKYKQRFPNLHVLLLNGHFYFYSVSLYNLL